MGVYFADTGRALRLACSWLCEVLGPREIRGIVPQGFSMLAPSLSQFFRFLGSLLWFVLGYGGRREAPGGPGKAHR